MESLDNEPITISSGDESDDGIAFVGSSNKLPRPTKRPITAVEVASSDSEDDRIPGLEEALAHSRANPAKRPPNRPPIEGDSLPGPSRRSPTAQRSTKPARSPDTPLDTAPKAKATLTREEREGAKRVEKEAKQLAKVRAKVSCAQRGKLMDQADKEAERSRQKKLAEVNKLRTSKNTAVREIELHFSADLALPSSSIAGALPEIKARLDDNQCKYHFDTEDDSPFPGVIKFNRQVKAKWSGITKQFIPLDQPRWEWEKTILLLATADDVIDRISQGSEPLSSWISDLRLIANLTAETQVILLIRGLEKYYAKTKTLANREFTAAARASLAGSSTGVPTLASTRVEKETVETALIELQVQETVFIVRVERTEDIEDWIWNLSADIAFRPYKLLDKSHLPFAPPEHPRKATSSTDALELMLQEVIGVTPSAASGIAAVHPTFAELMEAFEHAEARGGVPRAEAMLENCEIKNLKNGTASGRKLNKALAKKVYQAFRGEDSLALA